MRRANHLGKLAAILIGTISSLVPIRGGAQSPAAELPSALRVCADPDNLPFSSSKADQPGIYIEIARKIAETLGRPFEAEWTLSYFGAYTVRNTLLAKHCDMYVGLPRGGFMGPKLIFSKPFLHVGYALMMPPDMHVSRIGDLAGKRVAVQFSSTPQLILSMRDDVTVATFLNPEEAVKALADGKVDAAFVWGPSAGYINVTSLHNAFTVMPVESEEDLQFPVAIAFNRTDTELRGQVDRFLDANRALVEQLTTKYGLPSAAPVTLGK